MSILDDIRKKNAEPEAPDDGAPAPPNPLEAIRRGKTPTPNSSSSSPLPRQGAMLGSNFLSGAESGLDVLGGAIIPGASLLREGLNYLAPDATPAERSPAGLASAILHPGGVAEGLTSAAGLTNNPFLAPQSSGEALAAAAARGTGSAAAMLPMGGGVIPSLLSGAAGGAAGEATHQLLPDSKIAPLVAGTLAGLVTGHGASEIENAFSASPFERVAAKLGTSENHEQAGVAAQEAVRDWKTNVLPTKLSDLSAPLDAKIPSSTPVNMSSLESTLQSMTTKSGGATPLSELITSKLPQQLRDRISAMTGLTGMRLSLTWQDARALRTQFGDLMANPKLIAGADSQTIKGIYKAISDDLGTTAKAQNAGDEWTNYNAGSNKLYQVANTTLSKLSSDANPSNETIIPGAAASSLLNTGAKDSTHLRNLRAEVPEAADELAASFLRNSPEKWKSLNAESKEALVPDRGDREVLNSSSPTKSSAFSHLAHVGESILGGTLGEALGEGASHLLGASGVPPELSRILGIAAPIAFRGAKAALSRAPVFPLIGGAAGASANGLATRSDLQEEPEQQRPRRPLSPAAL